MALEEFDQEDCEGTGIDLSFPRYDLKNGMFHISG
jgi:hypothetical protein